MPPNITQVIKLANSEHGVKPIQLKLKVRCQSHSATYPHIFMTCSPVQIRTVDHQRIGVLWPDRVAALYCCMTGAVVNERPKL